MAQASVRRQLLQQQEDGGAQPNRDSEVIVGGPGQEPEDVSVENPPAAPPAQEVTINGRKFAVDPELAQAIEQRNKDFDRTLNEKLSDRDRQLADGNRRLADLEKRLNPPTAPAGYGTLLFEDPDKALNQFATNLEERITSKYQADQSAQRFWNDFYSTHKDLDRAQDDFIVQAVLQENLSDLAPKPTKQALQELGDLTRRQILRLSQKARIEAESDQPITANRTRSESASHPSPRAPAREPEGPTSLSDVIKSRRKARMASKSL